MLMRVVVRLRTPPEGRVVTGRRANRGSALMFALTLAGLGLLCFAICLWRWCFDLELVAFFPLQDRTFARWQVWFGLGLALHLLASPLVSYAVGGSSPEGPARRFGLPDRRTFRPRQLS
jgi:hypothetical protein